MKKKKRKKKNNNKKNMKKKKKKKNKKKRKKGKKAKAILSSPSLDFSHSNGLVSKHSFSIDCSLSPFNDMFITTCK